MGQRLYYPDKSVTEMSTDQLILELFQQDRTAVYSSQEEMVWAIKKRLNIDRTQSAISKGLNKLFGTEIIYNHMRYHIVLTEQGYMLLNRTCAWDNLLDRLSGKKIFEDYTAFTVNKQVVAFSVRKDKQKYLKKEMINCFGEQSFFDIVSNEDKIYFLLNDLPELFNQVKIVPQTVKECEDNEQHLETGKTK